MSWDNVVLNIDFYDSSTGTTWNIYSTPDHTYSVTDVSVGDQLLILQYLQEVYNGSATARNFIDLVVQSGTRIKIGTAKSDIIWQNDNGSITDWLAKSDGSGGFISNDANAWDVEATSWHVQPQTLSLV